MKRNKFNQVAVHIKMAADLTKDLEELADFNAIPRTTLIRLILHKYINKNKGKQIIELID